MVMQLNKHGRLKRIYGATDTTSTGQYLKSLAPSTNWRRGHNFGFLISAGPRGLSPWRSGEISRRRRGANRTYDGIRRRVGDELGLKRLGKGP